MSSYRGAMPTRVLPDANVLHARTLRDWLLLLKDTGNASMFHVFYTEDILAETIQSIRRRNPGLTGTEITKIRDAILLIDDSSPRLVRATLRRQIRYFSGSGRSLLDFAGALVKSDCPAFAERIAERCREIAFDQ